MALTDGDSERHARGFNGIHREAQQLVVLVNIAPTATLSLADGRPTRKRRKLMACRQDLGRYLTT
jgi:hypothetical protein